MTEFILRSTLTSPFGRKVRFAAEALGVMARITLDPADTMEDGSTLRAQNPLGKMPCLLLRDGTALFDSRTIIEFLQEVAGTDRLLPLRGVERYTAMTRAVLADGIADAGLLMTYEGRFRGTDPSAHSPKWLAHQRGKIERGLAVFEAAPPDPQKTDVVSIALSCALAYLDWRKPLDWRAGYPRVVQWLDAFARHEPLYEKTRAPEYPA